MALLILGTIVVALICALFLRGAFLGFGKAKSREFLNQLCAVSFALLGITILVFTIFNATKPWPGVILSITFLFSALAFRWVSKAPVVSA